VGDRLLQASALSSKGDLLRMLTRYDEALAVSDAAVVLAREVGNRLTQANALHSKGDTLVALTRYDEAIVAQDASLALAKEIGARLTQANALNSKGNALRMLDRAIREQETSNLPATRISRLRRHQHLRDQIIDRAPEPRDRSGRWAATVVGIATQLRQPVRQSGQDAA
jgi:tetratricopeptide (TPR) repeat protein